MIQRIRFKMLVISLMTGFYCYTVCAQSNKSISSDNKLKTKLDSAVDYAAKLYLQDSSTHGISIGIYYNTKKYTYNYNKTKADKLPSADNFYNIGSVAKTFATTMLAQAVIDKKLSLNDDIRKFLPGQYPNLQYQGVPIRFANLANHTSSLPTTFKTFSSLTRDSLKKLDIRLQLHFYAMYNADTILANLHSVTVDTLPGTKYQYNSSAMTLLILLLERVYHQPYDTIIKNYLATHLKIYNTKPFLNNEEIKRAVQGYDGNNNPQPFLNLKGYYFGPTINSTINDMLAYIKANLIEKDAAIKLTHQITFGKKSGFALGLGWMMDNTNNGKRYIYHDGNTKIGYNTLCLFYPAQQLGYIIIANDTENQERVGQIENIITSFLTK